MSEIKASFDLTTIEGQARLFNAKNGSSKAMKDLQDGEVIECVGIVQYPEVTDTYGKPQDVVVTVLFAKDGSSFASVSESVAKAGENLLNFVESTGLETYNVKIVKAMSRNNQEFLNLQLVM